MARSDVNSADSPQGKNGGDIETGDVNNANRTNMTALHGSQVQNGDTEIFKETNGTHMATPTSPQVQATCETQRNDPSQTQATQPCRRPLFSENRDLSVGLHKAALNGDWETAKRLLGNDPPREILCASITKGLETALHVAAGARQAKFVEKLIGFMEPEDLKLPDKNGNTAFCLAAAAGAKSIAEIMIDKNQELPTVQGNQGLTPLYMAATYGQCEMVRFLHPKTEDILEREANEEIETKDRIGTGLFFAYIDIGLFDLALTLLRRDSELAVIHHDDRGTALHMLARMHSAFPSKGPGIWKTLINSCMTSKQKRKLNQTDDALKLVRCLWEKVLERDELEVLNLIRESPTLLSEAAKSGNFKFLAELVHLYPSLIWEVDENGQTIFHIAVLHRHENIFNQIHKIGSIKDIIVEYEVGSDTYELGSENNILHLAAKLPCPSRLNVVSGAALQMQRELIWFQEVEKTLQPSYREKKNLDGKTPRELFTEEHKDLLERGEKWMQKTATSSMLVATLITTVVFAAAFTIPGNYTNDMGIPLLLKEKSFSVFAISNAMAMISSSMSILMFLSILTSRYTEDDFLRSLPSKLIIGLTTLFISIASMLLAFSTTFYIDYHHKSSPVSLIFASLALVPAILFAYSQRRLFLDVIRSTYGGFRSAKQKLF